MGAVNKAQWQGRNTAGILGRLANATKKHQATLGKVLERVPEEARAAIRQAMQVSQRRNQVAVARLQRVRRAAASGEGSATSRREAWKAHRDRQPPPWVSE